MRVPPERLQRPLKLVQRRTGKTDHLPSFVDQADLCHAQRADDDDVTVIIVVIRCRAAGESRIGRLHDDDLVGGNGGFQHPPLLNQVAGPHHRQCGTRSEPKTGTVAARCLRAGQHMAASDDRPQLVEKTRPILHRIVARRVDTNGIHNRNSCISSDLSVVG